jgi:hypothetical protein
LEHGWPGRSLVGEDGAEAAWLIALHADHDVGFQRTCARKLEQAVERGEAPARHLAYLTDRLLVHEGQNQRYGTQVRATTDGIESFPVEDPEGLDARRAEVGLEPMQEYLREAAARALAGESLQP